MMLELFNLPLIEHIDVFTHQGATVWNTEYLLDGWHHIIADVYDFFNPEPTSGLNLSFAQTITNMKLMITVIWPLTTSECWHCVHDCDSVLLESPVCAL